jgi:hypothetical protein
MARTLIGKTLTTISPKNGVAKNIFKNYYHRGVYTPKISTLG